MSGGPRVVVDARMARDGGIGTYIQQLVPRIARRRPDWRFTAIGDRAALNSLGWGDIPTMTLVHTSARIFSVREQIELPLRLGTDASLLWAPHYDFPFLAPMPVVVTIHDVNHLALPHLHGGPVRHLIARGMITTALLRARAVLYDSEFTRTEAVRLLGRAASKGSVVHLGVDAEWRDATRAAPPIDGPYFVYVGNIKRHKNVPLLLRAFASVAGDVPHRLVLIARSEGLRTDPDVASALGRLGDRVVVIPHADRAALVAYMINATAMVTASLYEGFGLPALEAMAAGIPCLVSNAGSLPEICADAALYADPANEASFAAGMRRLATDAQLRETLRARGRSRAAQFSWDTAADQTAAVLGGALAGA